MLAANRMNGRPSSDASSEAGYEVSEKVSAMEGSGSASLSTVRKSKAPVSLRQGLRSAAPFIPSYDITRGIMHAGQAAIGFAFMLCVMCVLFHFPCVLRTADVSCAQDVPGWVHTFDLCWSRSG